MSFEPCPSPARPTIYGLSMNVSAAISAAGREKFHPRIRKNMKTPPRK